MRRHIARQIKRLCHAAKLKRKIYAEKDFVMVNEDIVRFEPTNTFISRLATVLLETPATKATIAAQHNVLQQLKTIDTTFWDING